MLKIEYVKTAELKPYAGNAKLHPAEQIEQIKTSITEFGFNDPIAVWKDNEIIEGHGRLLSRSSWGWRRYPSYGWTGSATSRGVRTRSCTTS